MKNIIRFGSAMLLTMLALGGLTSCDDWTEPESVKLIYDTPDKANPKAYAAYCANLREYRQSDHKLVYTWFDNAAKVTSRAQRLTAIPDSVDVIVLTNPAHVSTTTLDEMATLRKDKGMKIYYEISFADIKASYVAQEGTLAEGETMPYTLDEFVADSVATALSYANKAGFDGIIANYVGKYTLHLSDDEVAELQATEAAFLNPIMAWATANPAKHLDFAGKPDVVTDATIFDRCDVVFLTDGLTAKGGDEYGYITNLLPPAMPMDKIGHMAYATTMDPNFADRGYMVDGSYSIVALATWAYTGTAKAVAFVGINDDFYNPQMIYPTVRTAIQAVNPAIR